MTAIPYCGPAPLPGAILSSWNLDPAVLILLAGGAWLLRREPGQVQAGLGLLFVAYVSPLCPLSAGLFSARAIHHLLVVFGAAPLLAGLLSDRAMFRRMSLSGAFLMHTGIFWAWHVPVLYRWALSDDAAYWIGQAALLGSALLFWRALFRRDTPAPSAFFILIAMVMQMGLLGAVITFAPDALYAPHFLTTRPYGLSPLEDQQLAGLIMWVGSLPLTLLAGRAAFMRVARGFREAVS